MSPHKPREPNQFRNPGVAARMLDDNPDRRFSWRREQKRGSEIDYGRCKTEPNTIDHGGHGGHGGSNMKKTGFFLRVLTSSVVESVILKRALI